MPIDFTRLSAPISNALDSDYIDIYRQFEDNPERDLFASNVKCHISIKTSDNPNPENVDVQPIITSLRIHCDTSVDLQNNDYIIAKKCDLLGNALHYYAGIIGEPAVSMARQFVNMQMSSLKQSDEPIPPPPADESVSIIINYYNEVGEPIYDSVVQEYKKGSDVIINPLTIDNYTLVGIEVNDETVEEAVINNIQEDAQVNFYYEISVDITSIRVLVNGDYIKDNGAYAYGLHLYAPISVLSVINSTSLKLASNKFYHEEMGNIEIKKDTKFRDNLENWHIVTAVEQVENGYLITFADTQAVECYVTHWYN